MQPFSPPQVVVKHFADLPRKTFFSGDHLITKDNSEDVVWFIESGLTRLYSISAKGQMRNHSFYKEGDWVGGALIWSKRGSSISTCAVEAIETTSAAQVSVNYLLSLRKTYSEVGDVINAYLVRTLASRLTREADLMFRTPEERYAAFLNDAPDLASRLSLFHIAAWLGVTQVALSRIRKRMGLIEH